MTGSPLALLSPTPLTHHTPLPDPSPPPPPCLIPQRDLSPYCADQLLRLVAHLQHDYQEALWGQTATSSGGGSLGGGSLGGGGYSSSSSSSSGSSGSGNGGSSLLGMEYIAGGSVGLFTLRPDLTVSSSGGPSPPGYYLPQPSSDNANGGGR